MLAFGSWVFELKPLTTKSRINYILPAKQNVMHRELEVIEQNNYFLSFTKKQVIKTYNSEDSLVVTHPTTNSPACGLSTAERTGSPVLHTLWSYVLGVA